MHFVSVLPFDYDMISLLTATGFRGFNTWSINCFIQRKSKTITFLTSFASDGDAILPTFACAWKGIFPLSLSFGNRWKLTKTGSYRKRGISGLLELNNGSQSCCFVHLNIFLNSRGSVVSRSSFPFQWICLLSRQRGNSTASYYEGDDKQIS